MKALTFCRVLFNLYQEFRKQQSFNTLYLNPAIASLESEFSGNFTPEQLFKIKKYYALYIPTLICSQLKNIYSQKLTDTERERAVLFGILTPLYDDLFDLESWTDSDYKQITLCPNEYQAKSFLSGVVKALQSKLISNVSNRENYLNACENVLNAQLQSKLQAVDTTTSIDLKKITFDKGGYSVILYHHLLDHEMTQPIKDFLYTLGSAYQLSNDIFDIYKDVRDGIYTLANTCKDFIELKKSLIHLIVAQNNHLRYLNLDPNISSRLLLSLNLVNSRTLVALDDLASLHPSLPPKPFEYWKSKERHEIIIDMEKPINILKWLWYTYKIAEY